MAVAILDGAKLQAELDAAGMSQERFAYMVDLAEPTVNRAIRGYPVDVNTVNQIALGVDRLRRRPGRYREAS